MSESGTRYGVIVPVKPPAVAKSRLGDLGDPVRRELAAAFAQDTVVAALRCELVGSVLAVTDDHALAADLAGLGAEVIPDGVGGDLNTTLALAASELRRRHPHLHPAALCADLPALRPEDLATALAAVPPDRAAFVADTERSGTTLLAAPGRAQFLPQFGPGSREEHLHGGAVELEHDVPTLRRDVDTPADLEEALRLDVGEHTARTAAVLL